MSKTVKSQSGTDETFELASTEYEEKDFRTWTWKINGFHLDGVQQAKSYLVSEYDIKYEDLRGKVIEKNGTNYVFIMEIKHD